MHSEQPDFRQRLHEHGFRATPGRIRLLQLLWLADHPLSVEEISRKTDSDIVTVYRALDDLCRAGLVLRGITAGEIRAAHFSYKKHAHHHHLVCVDCGFIKQCSVCE